MSTTYPDRTVHKGKIESGRWADEHGLIHSLLPYGYRTVNPIESLYSLRQTFEGLGKYKQTFGLSHVKRYGTVTPTQKHHFRLLHWAGSWAWKGWDTNNAHNYCNPEYLHDEYPTIDDTDRRQWLIVQTIDIPHWGPTKLAQAFGVTPRHATRLRKKLYPEYNRSLGREKFTRTIKTLHAWGYQWNEISYATGYDTRTFRMCFRKNHALDFQPPSNPCAHD